MSSWGEGIIEMFHLSKQFTAMEPSNAIASLDKVQILDGLIILNALFDILMGSPLPPGKRHPSSRRFAAATAS